MPELPEVEMVRRQLEPHLKGKRIKSVWAAQNNYFFVTSPRVLKARLPGRQVTALTRLGKYLVAELDDGSRLLCHLGMTGQITQRSLDGDAHVHLILHLDGGSAITFKDVRKFGKVEWIASGKSSPRLDKLGIDALQITPALLQAGLTGRKIAIKSALLNQAILTGVGNIYADEALFSARLHPERTASSLTPTEVSALALAVVKILKASVKRGGSTISDYITPDGKKGGYQAHHEVYGHTGAPCPKCRRPLLRTVIGGRSSHFCPHCQK